MHTVYQVASLRSYCSVGEGPKMHSSFQRTVDMVRVCSFQGPNRYASQQSAKEQTYLGRQLLRKIVTRAHVDTLKACLPFDAIWRTCRKQFLKFLDLCRCDIPLQRHQRAPVRCTKCVLCWGFGLCWGFICARLSTFNYIEKPSRIWVTNLQQSVPVLPVSCVPKQSSLRFASGTQTDNRTPESAECFDRSR